MASALHHGRRASRCSLIATLALAIVAVAPLTLAGASAQSPTPSVRAPLTDLAGVLDGPGEQAVRRAIEDGQRRGIDLHVLFVATTDGLPAPAYAERVAAASSMGGDDALLLVAFADRAYALWTGEAYPGSAAANTALLDRLVAPRLRAGDVPGAVTAAVDGLEDLRRGRGPRTGRTRGVPILPLVALGLGGILLWSRLRSRRDLRGALGRQREELAALAVQANAALVRVDDELRDAEHEAGFAEAQFGAEEAARLRGGLDRAKGAMREAFSLRQRLDDAAPDTALEQRALLEGVIRHAGEAEAVLDDVLSRLEELRGIERDPAAAAAHLRARLSVAVERLAGARVTAAALAAAAAAGSAVDGNVVEAHKRLEFAEGRLEQAASASDGEVAPLLRTAGVAVAQAEELLDAVDELATRMERARAELPGELREAELALARAEEFVRSRRHVIGREARTRLAEAQRRYELARELAADDPARAAVEADEAERLADEAYGLAQDDADEGHGGGPGGIRGFGWGLPMPVPFPIPMGGGFGWGGSSWGHGGGFGGSVGGGGFGGGSVGGGRW